MEALKLDNNLKYVGAIGFENWCNLCALQDIRKETCFKININKLKRCFYNCMPS